MTQNEYPRKYQYPNPGRLDVEGTEWHACDPYPSWYRWENGELLIPHGAGGYEEGFDYFPGWADEY